MGPGDLSELLGDLVASAADEGVLVGPRTADDAGVFALGGTGIVATADFIAAMTGKTVEKRKTVADYFKDWQENAQAHLTAPTARKYEHVAESFIAYINADQSPVLN